MTRRPSLAIACVTGFLLAPGLLLATGCGGSGPDLGSVKGTITLDGKPLAGAKVEFDLNTGEVAYGKMTGSVARGRTDANGRYTLEFSPGQQGAPVGKHTVRITTREMIIDAQGKEVLIPERLPPRFNVKSELVAEVKPGSNVCNFDLKLQSSPGEAAK